MGKIKVRVTNPWIGYPGSTIQQSYGEDLEHGFFEWDVRDNYVNAKFHELINPGPFVTIEWQGDVESTLAVARATLPKKCRIRISAAYLTQRDVHDLSSALKSNFEVIELTWKMNTQLSSSPMTAGGETIQTADLRNPDALLKLLKGYHSDTEMSVSDEEWLQVQKLLVSTLSVVMLGEEDLRNVKWTLRRLSFDNTFCYGAGNVIDFDKLSGITGLFGPNRIGKSSLIGSIMYALFNSSDRGSIKNLHLINARKEHCLTQAIINVGGVDYVIERQTLKNEKKSGQVNGITSLNVFRVRADGTFDDLIGEQRSDTEKFVRSLIGTADDFKLTSLAVQGGSNAFIEHGTSRRSQIMSRFLDLDVMRSVHDLINKEANSIRSQLKSYANVDGDIIDKRRNELKLLDDKFTDTEVVLGTAKGDIEALRLKMVQSGITTIVTQAHVDQQETQVSALKGKLNRVNNEARENREEIEKHNSKLAAITALRQEHNVVELRNRAMAHNKMSAEISSLRHQHDKEASTLKTQKKSLKILDDVPCGDSFPTCKFISDAHKNKPLVDVQHEKVESLRISLENLEESYNVISSENINDKLKKMEKLLELETKLKMEVQKLTNDVVNAQASITAIESDVQRAVDTLDRLKTAHTDEDNLEVVTIKGELDTLLRRVSELESTKLRLMGQRGKLMSDIEKMEIELSSKDDLFNRLKLHELIVEGFSKKGLPNLIIQSQLPLINAEISKILHGIVDFTVELAPDGDSDSLEVFINYGDSRRIIELGSGMEKFIASIAIRVALINTSTLSKTDTFFIDEGFGSLDPSGVEACNRLLISLKSYFRSIIMISHVDGVKDIADHILEITKTEKDAQVKYVNTQ